MSFSHYEIHRGNIHADTIFIPSLTLPSEFPITTPFTLPIIDKQVVLAKDKMNWWNPLGGHIEEGETWQMALKREALEEAGVVIKDIQIVGYVRAHKIKSHSENCYPDISLLPFAISKVEQVVDNWSLKETKDRVITSFENALSLLKQRDDNFQMYEIFSYILQEILHYEIN